MANYKIKFFFFLKKPKYGHEATCYCPEIEITVNCKLYP